MLCNWSFSAFNIRTIKIKRNYREKSHLKVNISSPLQCVQQQQQQEISKLLKLEVFIM